MNLQTAKWYCFERNEPAFLSAAGREGEAREVAGEAGAGRDATRGDDGAAAESGLAGQSWRGHKRAPYRLFLLCLL